MVNNTSSILILQKLWLVSEKALFFMLGYCAKFGQKVLWATKVSEMTSGHYIDAEYGV